MKRLGRRLMALGILALIAVFIWTLGSASMQPAQSLKDAAGVISALGLLGLVGGFFLWLIGIVTGSEGNRPATPVQFAGDKKCPQCAEFVQRDAKICRFCRYEFPAP